MILHRRRVAFALVSAVVTVPFFATPVGITADTTVIRPDETRVTDGSARRSIPLADIGLASSTPGARTVSFAAAHDHGADLSKESAAIPTGEAIVAGVVWPGSRDDLRDEHAQIEVRTRAGSQWSPWQELHVDAADHGHAPDPGSPEAITGTEGTDPVIVLGASEIQIRTSGPIPEDATLELVADDPGAQIDAPSDDPSVLIQPAVFRASPDEAVPTTALPVSATDPTVTAAAMQTSAPAPKVLGREIWDAAPPTETPRYGTIRGIFIHHTATTNDYAASDVPSLLRSIQHYHMNSRGWADIGYNFVIDRFGRLWEGRAGGVDRPVIGVHTSGYNSSAFAVSYLGNTGNITPSATVLETFAEVIGWKFSLHDLPSGQGTVSYPDGPPQEIISGHRDASATACPGERLYDRLGEIRTMVTAILQLSPPDLLTAGAFRGPGSADLVARAGDGRLWLLPSDGRGGFDLPRRIGIGWDGYDTITNSGDMNGDGLDDLIARTDDGRLWMFPGNGRGWFDGRHPVGTGWAGMTAIVGVGDMTGNGAGDLVARRPDGTLWLFPGNGRGWFDSPRPIGIGWGGVDVLVGTRDIDSDGAVDMVAKNADGRLWLYPGNGRGWFDDRRPIGTGWSGIRLIASTPHWTGDPYPDVIAIMNDNTSTVFPGNGRGWFDEPRGLASPW